MNQSKDYFAKYLPVEGEIGLNDMFITNTGLHICNLIKEGSCGHFH